MLKGKIALALAAAMMVAALYGCSSNGAKSERDDLRDQVEELQGALGSLPLTVETLTMLVGRADITAAAYQALVTALGDMELNVATLEMLVGRADVTAEDYQALVNALGSMELTPENLMELAGRADIPAADYEALMTAAGDMGLSVSTLEMLLGRADIPAEDYQALVNAVAPAELTVETLMALMGQPVPLEPADLETEYGHEQAVVKGITETDPTMRPSLTGITFSVPFDLDVSVTGAELEAADTGAPDAGLPVQAMLSAESEADGTTTTDKAFVYSDREAPGALEWNEYYNQGARGVDGTNDNAPGMAVVGDTPVGVNADGDVPTDDADIVAYRVTFVNANFPAASNLFMAAAFPSAASQTFTYTEDPDNDPATTDDNRKFMGSFHGVMGEYECTDSCTAGRNSDGEFDTLTGNWQFTPTDGTSMVMGVDTDETYTYFGYWLRQTNPEDGPETVGVSTFTGGSGAARTVGEMGAVNCQGASGTCSATYSGKAAGKYAVKTLTTRGAIATLHTGQFVADVDLTANFGGDTIAALNAHKISGTISNFNDAADSMNRIEHWSVMLGTADTDDATANTGDTTGMHGDVASGDRKGMWTHQFYNSPTEATMPPLDVTGTFDAHWTDGHAIGAYGAVKDD